jgi:hypothetical protein
MCSDAPDTSGINAAAQANAAIAKEALDWYKQEYARTAPQRDEAAVKAGEVTDAQIASMKQQSELAQDYADYNKSTFRPLEQGIVTDAQSYDTDARREAAAASATADVRTAMSNAQGATTRALNRMNVNPAAGRAVSMQNALALEGAKAEAGAATNARQTVEATGRAMKMDAASLGRNLPSAQATAIQTGTNAGNSAVGASNASLAASQSGAAMMGQGFNTAIGANQSAGSLYGTAGSLTNQARGQDLEFMSSVFGSAMKSDRRVKTGTGKRKSGASMLKAIEDTPVHEGWRYDTAKGGPDDGGQPHDGPMAQDVKKTMGEEAAPGGTDIDPITVQGNLIGAVQELSKRVGRMQKAMGR